jgi:hypothetical protein
VCPHAGGVGLCEYVIHLSLIDYICISGSMERNVLEYVDHLHEHFLYPCTINKNGRYNVPANTKEGYRCVMWLLSDLGGILMPVAALRCTRRASLNTSGRMGHIGLRTRNRTRGTERLDIEVYDKMCSCSTIHDQQCISRFSSSLLGGRRWYVPVGRELWRWFALALRRRVADLPKHV